MIPYADDSVKNNLDDGEYVQYKKVSWRDKILLNRPSKVIISLMITSILLPILLYNFVLSSHLGIPPYDGFSFGSCLVPRDSRIACGAGNIELKNCHQECCYDLVTNFCFHRLPSRFSYVFTGNWSENVILQPRVPIEPFSFNRSMPDLRLFIDEYSRTHLILHFYNSRQVTPMNVSKDIATDYTYTVSSPELLVRVEAMQGTIFNTMRGPLIAANNIWEITFKLTDETMYGLGEIPMIKNKVTILYNHKGGFNGIPLIYAKINDTYHGLLIDVETPTEVSIQGDNMVVVRSITNVGMKFHLFVGPEPADVVRDVAKYIGTAPTPDYWMLGAHVCQSVDDDTHQEAYDKLETFLSEAKRVELPYESHCGVAPLVFKDDDEYYEFIERGIVALEAHSKKFVPHVSPYVRFKHCDDTKRPCDLGPVLDKYSGLMLRDSHEIYVGKAQDKHVIYPDYDQESTVQMIDDLWNFNSTYYAVVLENSWPLDESMKSINLTYSFLPYYKSFEAAFNFTLPGDVKRPNVSYHLYRHNRYGEDFHATMKEYTQDAPILTSNQYLNGRAMINRQAVHASWENLQEELVQVALGGVSGNKYITSPVCGDLHDSNLESKEELCLKWYHAASFFPMIKLHSDGFARLPYAYEESNRRHMINALKTRLSLLPYFYTVLNEGPLIRPMFYQYPKTDILSNLKNQFAIGDSLLIVPDLLPRQTQTSLWMPPGVWYEFWGGMRMNVGEGQATVMASTAADMLTMIRGGSIVFIQKEVQETAENTRRFSAYTLVIALACSSTTLEISCTSTGKLFITKSLTINAEATGEYLKLSATGQDFTSLCDNEDAVSANMINDLKVYGMSEDLNDFDHHRYLEVLIDMCELEMKEVIHVRIN